MKISILYLMVFLCAFLPNITVHAQDISYTLKETDKTHTAYINPQYLQNAVQKKEAVEAGVNTLIADIEFDTIKLEKGRKFFVVSEQNLNNNSAQGVVVKFESVQKEYLAYNKQPSKIVFQGIIEKTGKPRLAGKSGTVKVKLEKITVDNITYPVKALISKMDNKNVFLGTLSGSPCYLANLANAANTGIIHNNIKDPCGSNTCTTNTFTRPLVFLGAAALQAADLLLSPLAAARMRGSDVNIPLNTYFEIKLDKELYVLNI